MVDSALLVVLQWLITYVAITFVIAVLVTPFYRVSKQKVLLLGKYRNNLAVVSGTVISASALLGCIWSLL